jgi:ERCC4-related helicase
MKDAEDPKAKKSAKTVDLVQLHEQKRDSLMRVFTNYLSNLSDDGYKYNVDHLIQYINILLAVEKKLMLSSSDPKAIMSLGQIENIMLDAQHELKEADRKAIMTFLKALGEEKAIITEKKTPSKNKG